MDSRASKWVAVQMLVLSTVFWGLSFPAMKSLAMTQQVELPEASSWFLSAICVVCRFGLAAILVALISWRTLLHCTRGELWQGIGLGFFGAGGILLQMDGLQYTPASTSAFLTQCYAVFIPLWLALSRWKWPSFRMLTGACLVMVGVAILAQVSWGHLRLGRGEWETIVASVFFTGQILWLERPRFAENDTNHFSAIMFVVMALVCLPVVILSARESADCIKAFRPPATWLFIGLLVIFCTMGGYMLMNRWQRHVPVAQAGLIYGLEPVFTSLFALFIPAWFSAVSGIAYPNEVITWHMLAGGGLIIAANILVQIPGKKETPMPYSGAVSVPVMGNQPGSSR